MRLGEVLADGPVHRHGACSLVVRCDGDYRFLRRVSTYRSGWSSFEFSCNDSPSDVHGLPLECFVCVDPLRVDWSDLTLVDCLTFVSLPTHSEVTQILQFLFPSFADCGPRQFFACDVIHAQDGIGLLLQRALRGL